MTTVTTGPMVRTRDASYRNFAPVQIDVAPVHDDASRTPSDRPFFIIGVHRSGTTLLRYMLTSSPRVCVPPESDFIVHWFHRLRGAGADTLLSPARVEALLTQLFNEHRYRLFAREWPGEKPTAELFCPDGKACSAASFVERLFATYAQRDGAARWGDKTPIYTSYIGLLRRLIPDARFVHIIRDGRDAALSMVEKWGNRAKGGANEWHVDLYWAAKNWVRRVRQARAAGAQLGDKLYMELRYEDLVAQPESHLRQICAFLDEPFDQAMLTPSAAAGQQIERDNPFHRDLHKPVQTSRVARWKQALSPAELRMVESIAGPLLRELGYECDAPTRATLGDVARHAALATKYACTSTAIRTMQALGLHPVN